MEISGDSDDPKDVAEGKASKKLLNTILNDPETYYFAKLVRAMMITFVQRSCVIKGDYRQNVTKEFSHYETTSDYDIDPVTGQTMAEDGMPYQDPINQKPRFVQKEEPKFTDKVLEDGPEFDVYPNQNVYMSPEYCYSLNDKEYIYFESEKTYDQLVKDAPRMGYFNLDLLKKVEPEGPRGESTYNKDAKFDEQPNPMLKVYVIRERWGKYAVIYKDGKYVPGIDDKEGVLPEATLEECIVYVAQGREKDDPEVIIGFRKSRHSKRPMARFLCYIDLFDDNGFGDGDITFELQKAIDDNYNLMNKRTQLSITPWFKGKRFSNVPEIVRVSPEHVTMLENLDDLQEVPIQDNIQGGIVHQQLLTSRMDYAMATSPITMGMASERAETAWKIPPWNRRQGRRSPRSDI